MEIEAKFRALEAIAPEQIEALALAPFALGPRVDHDLRDTLLDTAERALTGQRHALRLRRDGDEAVLTVKGPGTVEEGTHRRDEVERPLGDGSPDDPATWPAAILARLRPLLGEPLPPFERLVTIRNGRRSWFVRHGRRRVAEIALDEGTIHAGGATEPLHEVEVEIKGSGTEEELATIVGLLVSQLPLEPEPRSKSQRGLALLDAPFSTSDAEGEAANPLRAMRPDAPLAEAGRVMLALHLRKLRRSLPIAREGSDPEGVHNARVATRRLRAILSVLGATVYDPAKVQRLRRGLRSLAGDLGTVRDADVFLLALDEYAAQRDPDGRAGLQPLYEAVRARRDAGRTHLLRTLERKRTRRLLQRLARFVSTRGAGRREADGDEGEVAPALVRDFAGSALWGQYERVRAYEPGLAEAPIETLHRLRIAIKRLRYTVEFFAEALGPDAAALREPLTAAQELLGQLNDAEVALALVDDLPTDAPPSEALRRYRAHRAADLDELRQAAPAAVEPIFGPSFRQTLASLVAAL